MTIPKKPEIKFKPCADSGIMGSNAIVPYSPTNHGYLTSIGTLSELVIPMEKTKYLRIIGSGAVLVEIDLETGVASLAGSPNEAARVFWDAVEMERRRR